MDQTATRAAQADRAPRLEGLDVARMLAFVGMVIVNFDVVMVGPESSGGLAGLLAGRAAATFVVLAGLGLGLRYQRQGWSRTVDSTLRRCAVLLVIGLLNAWIFPADIIHYYAFYFLLGLLFVRGSTLTLAVAIAALASGFVALAIVLDYESGWDWTTLEYSGLWTIDGFVRNLLFNGWHPVVPWFAFVLLGIGLARLALERRGVQLALLVLGSVTCAASMYLSSWLMRAVSTIDPEAVALFDTAPVPPMPLFLLAGSGFACALIGSCMLFEGVLRKAGVLYLLSVPGRQALTLYIAHIFVGMGVLEMLGLIGGQPRPTALLAAALFCTLAVLFALGWVHFFRRGPFEALLRRLAG